MLENSAPIIILFWLMYFYQSSPWEHFWVFFFKESFSSLCFWSVNVPPFHLLVYLLTLWPVHFSFYYHVDFPSVIYPRGKVQNTRDASTGMGIKLILIREGKVWKFSILTMKWYISKSIFSSACFYICVLLSEIYKYRMKMIII